MTDQNAAPAVTDAPSMSVDLQTIYWFDHLLPGFAREWARLARWDRPVGIWLLYWPCAWGLLLAPGFAALAPVVQLRWLGLFWLGAVAMRGAGCTINDLWDRKLDARVARTASRPLAAGRIGVFSALVWVGVQCAAGLWVLWHLPLPAQIAALGYIPLIILYPLMKRITAWPQAFLSIVFSAGVLVGWLTIGPPTLLLGLLYLATMAWVLGYDTVYAHLDVADDLTVGIQSTVTHLGERAVDLVVVCWWAVIVSWLLIAIVLDFAALGWLMLAIAMVFQIVGAGAWMPDNDRSTLGYFRWQSWFGGMLAIGCFYTVLHAAGVLRHLPVAVN